MAPTTTAAPRHVCATQNLKYMLGPGPSPHIDLLARDATCRFLQSVVLAATSTEFAIPVRRNFDPDRRRPQMGDMAEKGYRTFSVTIFHFSVGRTHPAKRLDATLKALRHSRALALS